MASLPKVEGNLQEMENQEEEDQMGHQGKEGPHQKEAASLVVAYPLEGAEGHQVGPQEAYLLVVAFLLVAFRRVVAFQ